MKKVYIITVVSALVLMCGCGNTDKLNAYYSGMQSFCSNVQIITEEIDMVDINRDSAPKQISDLLDRLLTQFQTMSELEVPKNFASNEDLGDDAYNYMYEAVTLYKQWQSDPDDEDTLRMAKENYERALTRVNYMSIVLQGGLPEGDNITVYEEDATDFDPVIDDSSADDSMEEDIDDSSYDDEYEEEYEEESFDDFSEE